MHKCPKCTGRMFRETYIEPCRECRLNGASICGNDIVHYEWSCMMCGYVVAEALRRRRELTDQGRMRVDR